MLDTGSINGSEYRVGARYDNVDHGMTMLSNEELKNTPKKGQGTLIRKKGRFLNLNRT
ncbi:MAG: hypothetical protein ACXW33_07885 [Sulfuricurvum sp.]